MRVLLYIPSRLSGGAAAWVRNLVPELAGIFHQYAGRHHLVVLTHESQTALLEQASVDIFAIRGARPTGYRRVLWEQRHLARIVDAQHAEVLFVPYQTGFPAAGAKLVLMLRNMEPFLCREYPYGPAAGLRNRLLRWHTARSVARADRVIAVSDFARDYLVTGLGVDAARVRRVYHGRDALFSSDGDLEADRAELTSLGVKSEYVFTCGSMLPYRRCEDVVAGFDKWLAPGHRDATLVMAGSGSDPRYSRFMRRTVAGARCAARIQALGNVPQRAMQTLYRRCRAFVTATEIEACPNIAIEAMSSGCPILSGDSPPLPEIFGGCSMVFRARDIDDLGAKLLNCWENEHLQEDLRRRALARSRNFSWAKCAEATFQAVVDWPE